MEAKSKKSSLLSIILFITIIALVYSTQNMISPNLLLMAKYFGFGAKTSALGALAFAFMIVSGCSMVLFGYLADKINRKWIVFGGTVIYSVFSLFTILVPMGLSGYYLFLFLSMMNGVGFGAIIPSIFSLIGDLISQTDRSKGFSFFSIASLIGMAIGIGLATLVGSIDWRLSFFIVGVMGLGSAVTILFFKEPSRIGKDYLDLADKNAVDYSYRINKKDLKLIFKKKSNIWLIVNFVDTIPTGIILFLLFAYMEVFHNIPSNLTLVFLVFILLSTLLGTIAFGIIGDFYFKKGNKMARIHLAIIGNIIPIPFVFIALILPFRAPNNATLLQLFVIPAAVIMLILIVIGMFVNGATNGSWYATVVDLNLPEHRGTVLATANFFDIIGKAIGPLIGALIADYFGFVYGMMLSIIFWVMLPFFWIPVLRNAVPEMEATEKIFAERLKSLKASVARKEG